MGVICYSHTELSNRLGVAYLDLDRGCSVLSDFAPSVATFPVVSSTIVGIIPSGLAFNSPATVVLSELCQEYSECTGGFPMVHPVLPIFRVKVLRSHLSQPNTKKTCSKASLPSGGVSCQPRASSHS